MRLTCARMQNSQGSACDAKNINKAGKMSVMKKANTIMEQPVVWILILLFGFLIAWVLYKLMMAGTQRGLPAIFGG